MRHKNPKTTVGSAIGAVGTMISGAGVFFPPCFLIGAVISAVAKVYTGFETPDKPADRS